MATKPTKKTVKRVIKKKAPAVKKERTPKAAPSTSGLSVPVFNIAGKEVNKLSLPENIFGVTWKPDLVHQVVLAMQSNARAGLGRAHTKDRSEVRGGGKKPWRQKGTGRARHGSIRSPLWVGGGVTHGPRTDKDYSRTVPKKMRIAALASTLSRKLKDGEVLFVDTISFTEPKAAEAKRVLAAFAKISGFEKIGTKKQNAVLIAFGEHNATAKKSFNNFGNVAVEEARNLNPVDILSATYLIIENPSVSLKHLSAKLAIE